VWYYVLPGTGIFGGVKKGFHCADILTASGCPCAVATPQGDRATWFATQCDTLTWDALVHSCTAEDTILFSCPADAMFVDALPARRKILHMQGANTAADHALFDPARGYELISHGLHMTYELQGCGRIAPYVPIGIPDVFRWNSEPKVGDSIAIMPRKGGEIANAVRNALPATTELITIDGLPEHAVAEQLKRADMFVAISAGEAFGLPPLEAMSAGCCVVGFPGVGGFEFLRHMETAHLVPNGDLARLIEAVLHVQATPVYRAALRARGAAFARYYTMEREREYLLRALGLRAG
jgi:glycosyltransferase involved in cell wall biosynthesis